jgi:hypothetical protein
MPTIARKQLCIYILDPRPQDLCPLNVRGAKQPTTPFWKKHGDYTCGRRKVLLSKFRPLWLAVKSGKSKATVYRAGAIAGQR